MFERDKRYVYQAQTYRLSKTSEITVKGVKTLCVTCDSVTCHISRFQHGKMFHVSLFHCFNKHLSIKHNLRNNIIYINILL